MTTEWSHGLITTSITYNSNFKTYRDL